MTSADDCQSTRVASGANRAQVSVHLAYATADHARALIDCALYLPASCTYDPDRCAAAGVRADVGFATKPSWRYA